MSHILHARLAVATHVLYAKNAVIIEVAGAYQRLAGVLERVAPDNRERTLALDAMENSFLWITRSIDTQAMDAAKVNP